MRALKSTACRVLAPTEYNRVPTFGQPTVELFFSAAIDSFLHHTIIDRNITTVDPMIRNVIDSITSAEHEKVKHQLFVPVMTTKTE